MSLIEKEAIEATEKFLNEWGVTYRYHCQIDPSNSRIVNVTFSKPTKKNPAPLAVAHATFYLNHSYSDIVEFQIENERHLHQVYRSPFDQRLIDRVIKRKLDMKKKNIIDLTDDYINARVPKFVEYEEYDDDEILFYTESNSRKNQAESRVINAGESEESKRMRAYLINLFKSADKSNEGSLDYIQFRDLLFSAKLEIRRDDIDVLFAHADENEDGCIEYIEFTNTAVDLINCLKNKDLKAEASFARDKAAFIALQKLELAESIQLLNQLLIAADYRPPHQFQDDSRPSLSRSLFRRCLTAPIVGLTKEEANMIIAMSPIDESGKVLYTGFEELLYEVRYRIAQSQRTGLMVGMETYLIEQLSNQAKLENDIDNGRLKRASVVAVFIKSPKLLLSNFQIYSVIGEADEDANGYINYREFVPLAVDRIKYMFDPEKIDERAKIIQKTNMTPIELLYGKDRRSVEDALLEQFSQFDEDGNGVLDMKEFRECLQSMASLKLTDKEVKQLVALADQNGDGVIDYGEFVEISYNYLLLIARERIIESNK